MGLDPASLPEPRHNLYPCTDGLEQRIVRKTDIKRNEAENVYW